MWVDSPPKALGHLAGLPTLDDLYALIKAADPPPNPPLASDIAAGLARLRGALDDGAVEVQPPPGKRQKIPPGLSPEEELRAGAPLLRVLRERVRDALDAKLRHGFHIPIRASLSAGRSLPICWYGQQDAGWIAYYDCLRRLGLGRYRPSDERQFDDWAALARAAGWWWPGEEVCVLVERPAIAEPRRGGPPVVVYRDGWQPTFR